MNKEQTSHLLSKVCVVLLLAILGILWLSKHIILAMNTSNSLPQTSFLIIKGKAIKRGDYVAFYAPSNPLYPGTLLFVKQVAGVEGDKVSEKDNVFHVNHQKIGLAQPHSSKGIPLHKGSTGIIPRGHYFVYTSHPRSFDSRYAEMGWVPLSHVVGRGLPLFSHPLYEKI